MSSLSFWWLHLPNPGLFRFLKFLSYHENFLCLRKALEGSEVSFPEGIIAERKISCTLLIEKTHKISLLSFWSDNLPCSWTFLIFGILDDFVWKSRENSGKIITLPIPKKFYPPPTGMFRTCSGKADAVERWVLTFLNTYKNN